MQVKISSSCSLFSLIMYSFVEILPFVRSAMAIGDGMMGTMVITGEAGETLAGVQPLGLETHSAADVTHRAYIGTDAALDAAQAVDTERLVGDEPAGEGAPEQPRVDARPAAPSELSHALPARHDVRDILP